ncbi:MAG: sugar phosphate isomerase/epimerase family protein [Planctomycetota bacterium]
MTFRFCGFADEAGKTLPEQIDATKRAGWNAIEARLLEGKNFTDITDAQFDAALDTLTASGIQIVGFGAQIANWARPITHDFQADIEELKRTIPRLKKAGAKIIRCMSYPNNKEKPVEREAYKKEVFRRLNILARMAADAGVILGHENCNGYGGECPAQAQELLANVNNPAFKFIFDTGNNTLHDNNDHTTWALYTAVVDSIIHVHIKAAKKDPEGKFVACYPEEDPVQLKIISDLKKRGYNGWLSIEPHMAAAVHAGKDITDARSAADIYVNYARKIEALVAKAK